MRHNLTIAVLCLGLLAACGGSTHHSDPVSNVHVYHSIQYTNPSSSGWKLVRDASSTQTRLVLNLVGPSGTLARGVGLTLQGDTQALKFGTFTGGSYIQDAGVFELVITDPNEPKLLAGGVKDDKLMLGIFQKDYNATSKDCGATLLQCAVEMKASSLTLDHASLALKVVKAQMLPDDISKITSKMEPIEVAVGLVTLK